MLQVRCPGCQTDCQKEVNFCPACGYDLRHLFKKAKQKLIQEKFSKEFKSVSIFALIYLSSVLVVLFSGEDVNLARKLIYFVSWFDAIFILLFLTLSDVRIKHLINFEVFKKGQAYLFMFLVIPVLAVNLMYHYSLIHFFSIEELDGYFSLGFSFIGAFFYIAVMPGVFEELAFRGIMQDKFGRILNRGETYVLVSALFAIAHLNLMSAPYYFALSLLLCHIRQKNNSLIPCIVFHILHNFIVLIIEHLKITH